MVGSTYPTQCRRCNVTCSDTSTCYNETCGHSSYNHEEIFVYSTREEFYFPIELLKPKQFFEKPIDMELPKIKIPIKPINKRLSMIMGRHKR